ncbi:flagellar hook-length control protein FliK [Cellvibrio sp. NN19]|uniref:flagellar hook-length control protein FliK n=1 Tax=Cellvibrio chitinivorans TaxID=3102792 RepID=UPI002B403653|nr:flagellar hook-length control protein FliK [Cellvibrio sp. NN19]
MISASIQINAASQITQYAGENAGVAEATNAQSLERNSAGDSAAAGIATAETIVANTQEQQAELFVGQLDEVLKRADADFSTETAESNLSGILEKSDADQATQQQEMQNLGALPGSVQYGQQPAEQNVDAEQWLQAMLGQQQLQLQTRDATAPSAIANETVTPVAINPDVQAAQKNSGASSINIPLGSALSTEMTGPEMTAVFDEASANTNEKVQRQIATESSIGQSISNKSVINQTSINNAMVNGAMINASVSAVDARANESINVSHTALATVAKLSVGETSVNEISSSTVSSLLAATDTAQRSTQLVSAAQNSSGIFSQDAKLGEQLLHTLRDNVQLQIQQKIQNATIRLDPPELGSLEIYLSHEGGRLHVQITASQADVARLIQQTSDRLRQELSGPQFTQVNIQTSAEGQSGQQQSRQRYASDEMILANEQAFVGNETQTTRTSDVLVSV